MATSFPGYHTCALHYNGFGAAHVLNSPEQYMKQLLQLLKSQGSLATVFYAILLLFLGVELGTGAGVAEPEPRYILLEPEPENSSKNSGRQNYEKLILMQ